MHIKLVKSFIHQFFILYLKNCRRFLFFHYFGANDKRFLVPKKTVLSFQVVVLLWLRLYVFCIKSNKSELMSGKMPWDASTKLFFTKSFCKSNIELASVDEAIKSNRGLPRKKLPCVRYLVRVNLSRLQLTSKILIVFSFSP